MTETKTCSIDGCENRHKARGWCRAHYLRNYRHGDPLAGAPMRDAAQAPRRGYADAEEWFADCVEPLLWSDCVAWAGAVDESTGYGSMGANGPSAHRYAWERENGPIPDGMVIDHVCHIRSCVSVGHLRLATRAQNNANLSGPRPGRTHRLPRNVYRHHSGTYYAAISKGGRSFADYGHATVSEAEEAAKHLRDTHFGEYAGKG